MTICDGAVIDVPAERVTVVDKVGGGNTFNTGVSDGLQQNHRLSKTALNVMSAQDRGDALADGVRISVVTVSRIGANPPRKHELWGCAETQGFAAVTTHQIHATTTAPSTTGMTSIPPWNRKSLTKRQLRMAANQFRLRFCQLSAITAADSAGIFDRTGKCGFHVGNGVAIVAVSIAFPQAGQELPLSWTP